MIYVIYTCIAVATLLYVTQAGYLFVAVVNRGCKLGKILSFRGFIKLTMMAAFWPVTMVIFWIGQRLRG